MSNLFSANISAMTAAQLGLATTQHNIANANTAGYTRQQIVQNSLPAQLTGAGYIGQGTDVASIQRSYDSFLSAQVTQQQAQASQLTSYYDQIQQINNMIADPTTGVTPSIQNFFNAVNAVASSPDSMPARQTMLSTAQSLSSSYQALNQQLTGINDSINMQIVTSVSTVNSYAQQIATLNQSVVNAQAASGGKPPNDLLDQRDQLISQLNQQVKANVIQQSDGSYNISIGTGQLLVVGNVAYGLSAVQSTSDPAQLEVASGSANGALIRLQQNSLQGGSLGGLIAFRSQTLSTTQSMLGLMATGLAGTFNQQNQLGQDLNGAMASSKDSFFTDPVALINRNAANTGSAIVSASFTDYSKLTGTDFSLQYDGKSYTLTRLSDNTVTNYPADTTTIDLTNSDGISISIPPGAKAGDGFTIRPTLNGALNISVAISNPAKIAAAAPVMTQAALTNTGIATISAGAVDATFSLATITPPVTLSYDSTTNTLNGFPSTLPVTVNNNGVTTNFAAGDPVTYTDGATISFGGASFSITGTPINSDTFTIGQNSNATSDNRNALLLAALQTKKTLQGGAANYEGVYSQLVSQIGNKTNELKVTSTAQTTLVNQSIQAQQAVSGVNLDEEAANLMRYQQAYQAAGKAMQIASSLFDTLIAIGR
jgi:flagellar hook-associated protein 1 FlgK